MTTGDPSADAPAASLFPQFGGQLYEMITSEVLGLTDAQLDFESDRWEWSKWSIRRNLSHMASGDLRWLWVRWGHELFPDGLPNGPEIDAILVTNNDRRLDEGRFWALDDILGVLRRGMDFVCEVLSGETVGSMRSREIEIGGGGLFDDISRAGYSGIRTDADDLGKTHLTLEATFRHRYFEHITHLYNIQRLKRAQGLDPVVDIPMEGYLALPTWDLSEP